MIENDYFKIEVTREDSENHKKWERFKTHISHIHEFQDDECGGCERESADNCRKCMQELYWYNLKCYFDGEYIL